MRKDNRYPRTRLSDKQCFDIIDKASERGVAALSVTGGEPFLYPDSVTDILKYGYSKGITYTRTGTNGFMFQHPDKPGFSDRIKRLAEKLADSQVRNFWISIDSADPKTHEDMRGFTSVINGIEKAMPIFNNAGIYPTANLGINRNLGGRIDSFLATGEPLVSEQMKDSFVNEVKIGLSNFFQLVASLGFTIVNFCYPMSIDKEDKSLEAVYPASSVENIVRFTPTEKALLFKAMLETIPAFRSRLRIFSPLCALHTLSQYHDEKKIQPFPCRGGLDYFFINAADGMTYPCGYRGKDNLGDYRYAHPVSKKPQDCILCDWECFRDPSELFGILTQGLRNPLSLVTTHSRSGEFYRLWLKDLRYYKDCDFFNGRMNSDLARLRKHSVTGNDSQRSLQQGNGKRLSRKEEKLQPV